MKQSYSTSCWNVLSGCTRPHLWVKESVTGRSWCVVSPQQELWAEHLQPQHSPELQGTGASCPARAGAALWGRGWHLGSDSSSRCLNNHIPQPQGCSWFTLKNRSWALISSVFTHVGHTRSALLALLDLNIHLSGQKQMKWAKSQRDIRNTPFPHQRLHLLSQKQLFVWCCLA